MKNDEIKNCIAIYKERDEIAQKALHAFADVDWDLNVYYERRINSIIQMNAQNLEEELQDMLEEDCRDEEGYFDDDKFQNLFYKILADAGIKKEYYDSQRDIITPV